MPLFSILLPTFNSEATLTNALQSIASQTFKEVEVVLQDGGSTDATLSIAESFKPQISKLEIISEKDNGIYDAMNRAMKQATGDWLFFMGSDDTFYQDDVLEKVAEKLKNTSAKVVYGDAKIVGNTGWAKDGEIYAGAFSLEKLLNQNICHQAMFYNSAFVIDTVGEFTIDYKKSADWDFNLRCWAQQPFEYLDLIIANFNAGGFSSHSSDDALVNDFVNNVCEYFKWSLFHPSLNNPNFIFYKRVVALQKAQFPNRLAFLKFKRRVMRKLKSYFG